MSDQNKPSKVDLANLLGRLSEEALVVGGVLAVLGIAHYNQNLNLLTQLIFSAALGIYLSLRLFRRS